MITESECDNVIVIVVVVIAVVEGLMVERGKVVDAVVTGAVRVLHLLSHYQGAVVLNYLLEFYLFFVTWASIWASVVQGDLAANDKGKGGVSL